MRVAACFLLSVCAITWSAGTVAAQESSIKHRPVWTDCGKLDASVTYGELAHMVAPVLWFSPDEPLLKPDPRQIDAPLRTLQDAEIPGLIPRLNPTSPNGTAADRTVYYRVRLLRVKDGTNQALFNLPPGVHDTKVALDLVTAIYIRFFFYYPQDIGFGSHRHDLESVEMTLDVTSPYKSCYEIKLYRVSGAAHGVGWYTNTLNIYDTSDDPLLLPPVVLVEEGKHATVPDRNGDGTYNPGYDVNVNPNDAWGIRDGLRNNRQTGSSYTAEGAKPRHKMHRLFPEKFPGFQDSSESAAPRRGTPEIGGVRYKLREGGVNDENCQNGSVSPLQQNGREDTEWSDARRLHEFLSKTGFCAITQVKGPNPHSGTGGRGVTLLAAPYGSGVVSWSDRFSWGYSYVGGQNGASASHGITAAGGIGLGLGSLTGGWLVPRLTFRSESGGWTQSIDALYTPSVSRIMDWYLAVGADVTKDTSAGTYNTQVVEEFGLKLRVGWEPLIKHGLGFINFRLGYRGPLQNGLATGRWVIEVGFGGGF